MKAATFQLPFPLKRVLEMRRLSLVVYKAYFDAIVSGEKKIEYRDATDYWMRRLLKPDGTEHQFDEIEFRNGYQKAAPRAVFVCEGINRVGLRFEIHIGKRIR